VGVVVTMPNQLLLTTNIRNPRAHAGQVYPLA
jgi:hypothetical protein